MCYSAQIWADYRKFQKVWGSEVDIKEFVRLYWQRQQDGGRTKIPKGMDAPFLETASGELGEIHAMISDFNDTQAAKFEQELFAQSTRLNAAGRALQTKVTKKAQEDVRIATNKITAAREKLSSLRRVDPEPDDSRIFPGNYGLVMVSEGGRRVVKPMRYQCRMPGWTESRRSPSCVGCVTARFRGERSAAPGTSTSTRGLLTVTSSCSGS